MKRLKVLLCAIWLASIFSCQKPTERLQNYEVQGLDVSHHQGEIDWNTVSKQDFDFVFVKATEGATFQDTNFVKNWNAIRNSGLKRGAYHYFQPTTPSKDQVDNFLEMVTLRSGDLPPVLDVEILGGVKSQAVVKGALEWLKEVEKRTCTKPILYTYQKFYNSHFKDETIDYPIWIARYGPNVPYLKGRRTWSFWQYGNRGEIEGIEGYVDFNVFSGGQQEFENLLICLDDTP